MYSKSTLAKVFSLVCLMGLASACSSSGDEAAALAAAEKAESREVLLAEVSTEECLNVESYFNVLRAQSEDTRARKMTNDFKVKTIKASLPRNFYLSLAAGNFQIIDSGIHEVPEITFVKQDGCNTVTFMAPGHDEVYKITRAKPDTLTFENDWGGETTIQWKDPYTMRYTTSSVVTQDLCSSGSKARVTVEQTITWGDDSVHTSTIGEKAIDPAYLALVSEATGFMFNSLYSNMTPPAFTPMPLPPNPEVPPEVVEPEPVDDIVDPFPGDIGPGRRIVLQPTAPSDRQLVISRLKELQSTPIRPDLLQCY